MIRSIVCSLCLVAMVAISQLALAQEFSADIVGQKGDNGGMHKIYVGKEKMRIDMEATKGGIGALIIDTVQHKNTIIMPERHMYMEGMQGQALPMAFNFWRPTDADDACSQWKDTAEKMAARTKSAKQLGSCHKIGSDTVDGRSAVKYEGTDADNKKTSYVWVDKKLRFVTKMQTAEGRGFEMKNVQEGSQPGSLFEIPAGYTKFDMGAMMKERNE